MRTAVVCLFVQLAAAQSLPEAESVLLAAVRAERTLHGADAIHFSSDRDPLRRLEKFDLAAVCLEQATVGGDDVPRFQHE